MTVKRDVTATSATGATKFVYGTVATGVRCSLQDGGGRLRQDDVGQVGGRAKRATFGPEADLQQNDLLVTENQGSPARTFRVVHLHPSVGDGGVTHHQEATVEEWVPSGND